MRVRGMLATTALMASALLLPPAFAEDAPVDEACLLVKDTLNDTVLQDAEPTSGFLVQRDIDITSADVSTTQDVLYAVIRVQALDARPPTTYLQGETTYRLEFGSGTRRFYVQAPMGWGTLSPTRYTWIYGATAGRVGGRAYQVWSQSDLRSSEISIEAPLHVFGRGALEPGAVLTNYAVSAVRTFTDNGQLAPGVPSKVSVSDSASSKATYDATAPSCITPEPDEVDDQTAPSPEPTPEPSGPAPSPSPEPTEPPVESYDPYEPTESPSPEATEPTDPTAEPTATPQESLEPEPSGAPSGMPDEPLLA